MKAFSLLMSKRMRAARVAELPADGFDPRFYRATYPDLAHLQSDRELHEHYLAHGKAEGRFPSLDEMKLVLAAQHGPLPEDFDPRAYIELHPDLKRAGMTPNQAAAHYLRYGREEGRAYQRMNTGLFRELYLDGQVISDADLFESLKEAASSEGKLRTGRDVMRAKGVEGGGRWIETLVLDEFRALNADWADPKWTLMQIIDSMLDEGIGRLAPIAEALVFDPDFYREYCPELAGASDEAAYRHWLFSGHEDDAPGSARQFFDQLNLPLQTYPAGFKWERYAAAQTPGAASPTRWAALHSFVTQGFAHDPHAASGEGAQVLLQALGALHHGRNATLCARALRASEGFAALDDASLQRLGDSHFALGEWDQALKRYEPALGRPSASPSSHINAARAALHLNLRDRVFKILGRGREKVAGAPEFRAVVTEAIQKEFDIVLERVRDLLKLGLRSAADAAVAEAVKRACERYEELDPLGAPVGPIPPNGRVVILANVDLRQCTHYRVEQKEDLLRTLGRDYEVYPAAEADAFLSALPFASAAIFYRLIASPKTIRAIEVARALGVPTYYDIDDLLFDSANYPEPFETYGGVSPAFYQSLQLGVPLFRAALSLCDYAIASTSALAERMKPLVRKREAFVLPNGLDSRNAPFLKAPPKRVRRDDDIVIFYGSGTKAHNKDFLDLAGPALKAIMAQRSNVKLMIVGHLYLDVSFDPFRSRIVCVGVTPDVRSYWSLLTEADINIAVLAPFATTDAKSEIKWIEAAALGVPSVVSATHRYREVLEDGFDAFVPATPQAWREALERLIDDPALRRRMSEAARRKLQARYTLEANAPNLARLLDVGQSAARAAQPRKKTRVLLVNLFFHPQSLGGSPRVVKDNLDCFLDGAAPEVFEFAVATTDFGGDGLGQIRVEAYRGRPVFRVSPIGGPNSEWRPRQPEMGEAFAEILASWRPDLVHFHCTQRFSGSAVEACLAAGVPYVVTAHDAWWVSDWQFLTDDKRRLRNAGEPFPFDPPAGVNVGEALERRRYLAGLLNQADAVLAVSRAFAEIYRAAGFPQTRAVPNGAPLMALARRTRSPNGRVRLCHIGGMSKFKGFNLLRAAFRGADFSRLELTVVDETRFGGGGETQFWGETPVRIVGKTLAQDMPDFYARHDVLLAPSLWPEPFGLVTREALAAGLWVVASDRGAIGEDVTPGVNGFVVDVATPFALRDVLTQIDQAPAKFTQSPKLLAVRTAKDQAADLIAIYREVLERPRPARTPACETVGCPRADRSPHDLRARRRARERDEWSGMAGTKP